MSDALIYSGAMICAVFVASCAQILLKKSADTVHSNKLSEYFNFKVIVAYAAFCAVALTNLYVLRYIPVSLAVVLESSAYAFVPILSFVLLKERLGLRQIFGIAIIVAGIGIFAVGGI